MAAAAPRADAGQPAAGEPAARPVVRADVLELLRRYRGALELAADPPPSRSLRPAWLQRAACRLRPAWGLERMVIEHLRARVAQLDRRFALRLALGENDPDDDVDRAALASFAAALPPPRSRLWLILPLLAVIALSQALLALLLRSEEGVERTAEGRLLPQEVAAQLTELADLNPARFTDIVTTLLQSNPKVTALAIGVVTLAVYLVARPRLPAYRLKRQILGLPAALDGRAGRTPLGERARRLGVHDEERAMFAALAMPPPGEPQLDLRVKAVMAAILLGLAWLMFLPPSEPGLGAFFLAAGGGRLAWLGRERARRAAAQKRSSAAT